ncbi:hypothetical protein AOQ84DRAFT_380754 [Glonium stellatum]|uniref:Uncharacterized protein n=1 Tax=Glonium stellatum TaxID=574774 RepID=A0A8E2ET04_9PEZI|nr:hypothetical protein AOQ84DRAFT_380754 [Glonium stellatum]
MLLTTAVLVTFVTPRTHYFDHSARPRAGRDTSGSSSTGTNTNTNNNNNNKQLWQVLAATRRGHRWHTDGTDGSDSEQLGEKRALAGFPGRCSLTASLTAFAPWPPVTLEAIPARHPELAQRIRGRSQV